MHDVPARVFQHLPAGEERLEDVYQPSHGGQKDQLAPGGQRRAAEGDRGRLRDLLSGVRRVRAHYAVPPLFPRAVFAQVAVYSRHVSHVPPARLHRGRRTRAHRVL